MYVYVYACMHACMYTYITHTGESRRCYHGVPRVLTTLEDEATRLRLEQWRVRAADGSMAGQGAAGVAEGVHVESDTRSRRRRVVEYLAGHRLNINIRQVRVGVKCGSTCG